MNVERFGKLWLWWKKIIKLLTHKLLFGYVREGFIHGLVTKERACHLLSQKDKQGTFLFRISTNEPSGFVLTCLIPSKDEGSNVLHVIIHLEDSGFLIGHDLFPTLPSALIDPSKGFDQLKTIYPDIDWKSNQKFNSILREQSMLSSKSRNSYLENLKNDEPSGTINKD